MLLLELLRGQVVQSRMRPDGVVVQSPDLWAYHHGVRLDCSRPGKPTDNSHIETFNGSLRDECLNVHWFESLEQAKVLIELWRQDYNESRPYMALGNVSPAEFLRQTRASEISQAA